MVVPAEACTVASFWCSSPRFRLTSLPTPSHPFRLKVTAIRRAPILASLRSLRPRPKRQSNHLRRKLLKTLPPPHPVREAPQSPLEGEASHTPVEEGGPCELQRSLLTPSHELPTDGHALVLEEEEESALVVHQQPFHPNQATQSFDVPRLLLELTVYVVGLLVVQTVCAVWLFGGAVVEGRSDAAASSSATTNNVTLEKGKEAGPSGRDHGPEFERTVSAIRAMAREARAAEAREASEKDGISGLGLRGDVTDAVNRRLGRLKKRMPGVHLDARVLSKTLVEGDGSKACKTPTKGFNGKNYAASTRNLDKGGAQQIGCDFHLKEPSQLHMERKSSTLGYNISGRETSSSLDQAVLDFGNSQTFGNLNSDHGMTEKSRSDRGVAFGGLLNNIVSQEVVRESSPVRQAIHYEQSATSNKASGRVSKTKNMGTSHSKSFLGKKHGSSSAYRSSTTNSEVVSNKKIEHSLLHEKAKHAQSDAVNQLWWLKLPYVLAIFLHRGYDHKEYKGLYSLKLDSRSEEGSDSYTFVFQDRVDATNFCYLLESFFENLGDFSADIVPLSIQEVHDAVKSKALKVIVVRKGQLQLYAGQPLAEAEMQLRAMLS